MESQQNELTELIQQDICKALRIGASYELAACYAGVQVKWFWRWKKDGENDQAAFNDHYRQKCRTFSQEIKKARADYKVSCLTRMEKLGIKHFKPLQWKYEQLSAFPCQGQHKHQKRRRNQNENKNRRETL